MLTKHSIKVLIGFSGMIILGLISLVVIDYFREKEETTAFKTKIEDNKIETKSTKYTYPNQQSRFTKQERITQEKIIDKFYQFGIL